MKAIQAFVILICLCASVPVSGEVEIQQQPLAMNCVAPMPFVEGLEEKYGEINVFASQSENALNEKLLHQLWMNPTTETWTFTVINAKRDLLCIIASGQGFYDAMKQTGI